MLWGQKVFLNLYVTPKYCKVNGNILCLPDVINV